MTTSIDISCHCQLNKFSFPVATSSLPLPTVLCHCQSCRASTGGLFTTSVPLPSSVDHTSFPLGTTLRAAIDADGIETTRWFCVRCGAHMLRELKATHEDTGGRRWIARSGVVKDWQSLVEVQNQIFVGDTKDGGLAVLLEDEVGGKDIPKWVTMPGEERFVSDLTTTTKPPPSAPSTEDKDNKPVLVQCLCHRISLNLARPAHATEPPSAIPAWTLSTQPTTHFRAHPCVCSSCSGPITGIPFWTWTFVPLSLLSPTTTPSAPLNSTTLRMLPGLSYYNSSDKVQWSFCETCGATVTYQTKDRPEVVDLAVGLLRAEEGARAERWLEWRKEVGRGGEEVRSLGVAVDGLVEGMRRVGTVE